MADTSPYDLPGRVEFRGKFFHLVAFDDEGHALYERHSPAAGFSYVIRRASGRVRAWSQYVGPGRKAKKSPAGDWHFFRG